MNISSNSCLGHLGLYLTCDPDTTTRAQALWLVLFILHAVALTISAVGLIAWCLRAHYLNKSVFQTLVFRGMLGCYLNTMAGLLSNAARVSVVNPWSPHAVAAFIALEGCTSMPALLYVFLSLQELSSNRSMRVYSGLDKYVLPFYALSIFLIVSSFVAGQVAVMNGAIYYMIAWRVYVAGSTIFVLFSLYAFVRGSMSIIKAVALAGQSTMQYKILVFNVASFLFVSIPLQLVYVASPNLVDTTPWLWVLLWTEWGAGTVMPGTLGGIAGIWLTYSMKETKNSSGSSGSKKSNSNGSIGSTTTTGTIISMVPSTSLSDLLNSPRGNKPEKSSSDKENSSVKEDEETDI